MANLRQAAQQALEALESGDWYIDQLEMLVYSADDTGTHEERAKVQAAITDLRAALAEPEQEPVAWMYTLEYGTKIADRQVFLDQIRDPFGVCGVDYYQANADGTSHVRETPLCPCSAPNPRKPQPLTDAEILSVLRLSPPEPSLWPYLKDEAAVGDVQRAVLAIARAIEHAHGITGETK